MKIWDFNQTTPSPIFEKQMNVGELFTCEFYEDSPMTLACGGSQGKLAVWDLEENAVIMKYFLNKEVEVAED